jgi:hypothetical protein
MRLSPVLPILASLIACASAAPAQSSSASAPLVTQTGSPVAYRIGFPRGWKIEREDMNVSRQAQVQGGTVTNTVRMQFAGETLSAESGTGYVHLVVADVVPVKRSDLPVSWAEQRRIVTNTVLGSDSLLFGVLANATGGQGADFRDRVQEIRTLGGQRAGYQSGLLVTPGLQSRVEIYVTVKDGIVYVLTFAESDSRFAAREPLFARVRDSLVFAENAPVSAPE